MAVAEAVSDLVEDLGEEEGERSEIELMNFTNSTLGVYRGEPRPNMSTSIHATTSPRRNYTNDTNPHNSSNSGNYYDR